MQPLTQDTSPGLDETGVGLNRKRHLIIDHLATSSQSLHNAHCGLGKYFFIIDIVKFSSLYKRKTLVDIKMECCVGSVEIEVK